MSIVAKAYYALMKKGGTLDNSCNQTAAPTATPTNSPTPAPTNPPLSFSLAKQYTFSDSVVPIESSRDYNGNCGAYCSSKNSNMNLAGFIEKEGECRCYSDVQVETPGSWIEVKEEVGELHVVQTSPLLFNILAAKRESLSNFPDLCLRDKGNFFYNEKTNEYTNFWESGGERQDVNWEECNSDICPIETDPSFSCEFSEDLQNVSQENCSLHLPQFSQNDRKYICGESCASIGDCSGFAVKGDTCNFLKRSGSVLKSKKTLERDENTKVYIRNMGSIDLFREEGYIDCSEFQSNECRILPADDPACTKISVDGGYCLKCKDTEVSCPNLSPDSTKPPSAPTTSPPSPPTPPSPAETPAPTIPQGDFLASCKTNPCSAQAESLREDCEGCNGPAFTLGWPCAVDGESSERPRDDNGNLICICSGDPAPTCAAKFTLTFVTKEEAERRRKKLEENRRRRKRLLDRMIKYPYPGPKAVM